MVVLTVIANEGVIAAIRVVATGSLGFWREGGGCGGAVACIWGWEA